MARISKPPEERRQEIIDVAHALFVEKGYDQTTVRDIVNFMNVAQGLFYYYFKSKEEVLFAAAEKMSQQLINRIVEVIASPSVSPIDRVRAALLSIAEFLSHSYNALRLPTMNRQLRAQFEREARGMLLPYLTQLIEAGRLSGDFDIEYPEYTARFILAGFVGVCLETAIPTAGEIISLVETFAERILALPKGAIALQFNEE